jgi:hypothetical protein
MKKISDEDMEKQINALMKERDNPLKQSRPKGLPNDMAIAAGDERFKLLSHKKDELGRITEYTRLIIESGVTQHFKIENQKHELVGLTFADGEYVPIPQEKEN